jgi:hypothetical protein
MNHAVVGFDLGDDSLLQSAFLPLRQGLTVVYGLNGAGKTRLLRGIQSALAGIRSDVRLSLVVRADVSAVDGETVLTRGSLGRAGAPFLLGLAESLANPDDWDSIVIAGEAELAMPEARALEVIVRHIRSEAAADDELLKELLATRMFLLVPTGTTSAPGWDAWPIADPALPRAAAIVNHLEDAYHQADAAPDEAHDAAWETYTDLEDAVSLFRPDSVNLWVRGDDQAWTTSFVPYSDRWGGDTDYLAGLQVRGPLDFGLDLLMPLPDADSATLGYIADVFALILKGNGFRDDDLRGTAELAPRIGLSDRESRIDSFGAQLQRGDPVMKPADFASRAEGILRFAEDSVNQVAAALQDRTNRMLKSVLIDAPNLQVELMRAALRFTRPALRWTVASSGRRVPGGIGLAGLSRAEEAWAGRSIAEALYWHTREELTPPTNPLRAVLSILDEPEAALHRSAEAYMARALAQQAHDPRRIVIAATHSPELLDLRDAHVIEVRRGHEGQPSRVQELDLRDRNALDQLGLTPSDLLRWPRVFLLVEGEHDEVIINALLGDRLRAARVEILPLRGGKKLPHTVDSRVLFDFTEAHLVGLVDNQRADELATIWESAQTAAALGDTDAAVSTVVEGIGKETDEAQFLCGWLTAALRKGLEGRVTPYGLSAKDVIEYLPVESLVTRAESWDALKADHSNERTIPRKNAPTDFKKWLVARHAVDLSSKNLDRIASALDPIPNEFERLMKTLEARWLGGSSL